MIDSAPLAQFKPLAEGLLRPIYADYSFANIPATIHYLLTGERLRSSSPEGGSASEFRALLPRAASAGRIRPQQGGAVLHRFVRLEVLAGASKPLQDNAPRCGTGRCDPDLVVSEHHGRVRRDAELRRSAFAARAYGEVIQTLPFMPLGRHARDACLAKSYAPAHLVAVAKRRLSAWQSTERHLSHIPAFPGSLG